MDYINAYTKLFRLINHIFDFLTAHIGAFGHPETKSPLRNHRDLSGKLQILL